jgi:hypothetical protein
MALPPVLQETQSTLHMPKIVVMKAWETPMPKSQDINGMPQWGLTGAVKTPIS